jgi:ATP-dependent exoDNAse (exonuclease V) beta subunit
MNLKIISAGAGSGKTYRLTSEMVALLKSGVRPSGIIATTFTRKAANELQERVRVRLLEEGLPKQADELTNALIGTVHGLGVKLLHRFAFEAGVSPEVDIIADEDQQVLFNQSLSMVLTNERVESMEKLCERLGLSKRETYDWRKGVRQLTEVARANDFSIDVLEKSKILSFESFSEFLGKTSQKSDEAFYAQLAQELEAAIERIEGNADNTKKTQQAVNLLKTLSRELQLRNQLHWHQWVKISKLDVGAKSREDAEALISFAKTHITHPQFHEDIKAFIYQTFDIAIAAIQEYDDYKKSRGLIDYTDMEVLIKRLLELEVVSEVLKEELDLLMVDEFQDTSPIQLEIFLKLSQFAKFSVWVGDPKQSIYGFRGADPKLMQAIIEKCGGVKPEDIQEYSWRSREDIVFATNAIFTKAFSQLPEEQIALKPKRTKIASADSVNKENEPLEMDDALIHWHFQYDGEGRMPGKPWMENCIAESLKQLLAGDKYILPKGAKEYRKIQAGDIAILCRSNAACQNVAEALHRAGLKAAISRSGLLNTAEAKIILACLKFILNKEDSLSIAEILLLASKWSIEEIIEGRLEFLEKHPESYYREDWAKKDKFIAKLNELREKAVEYSSAETLDLLLEEMHLRRIVASWGKQQQRLDNVEIFRKLALQYEEACNRLHTAASLGGFLLWLNDLERNDQDQQSSGEGPDTINVMTYHKSKGLEWPVVLCHSLEGRLRADVWGVDIISEKEDIDLNNILGNRWLRFWVNPYADLYRNTELEERINASTHKTLAVQRARQEEARLLYVGITRARDYLIFPSREKNEARWLNRIWQEGEESHTTLDPHSNESPWDWKGNFLNIETHIYPYPREFTHANAQEENIFFLQSPKGKNSELRPYFIDADKEPSGVTSKILDTISYNTPIPSTEDSDAYQIAKALKAFYIADQIGTEEQERKAMASVILQNFEVSEELDVEQILAGSKLWHQWLIRKFDAKKVHKKYPLRYYYQDRLFETIADLILETDQGLVLIQNSGSLHSKSKAQALRHWLFLSKSALQEIFDTPSVRTLVHFVMNAEVLEMEVQTSDQQLELFG